MIPAASFYIGSVQHRRLRPRRHRLKHACYWMLLDIDRMDEIASSMRLFSHDRFNVLSIHARDHGDGTQTPLRRQIEDMLRRADIAVPEGAIRLFCMPRVLGHGFNPLSVYFCHDRSDALRAIVYEVHNTFGERHFYPFAVAPGAKALRHGCEKDFYVSPFMDMELAYDFRVAPPGEKVAIAIETADGEGALLFAALAGRRLPANDRTLLRLAFTQPLVTLKVVAAIHIHAAILWWKGVRVRRWAPGLRRRRAPDTERDSARAPAALAER